MKIKNYISITILSTIASAFLHFVQYAFLYDGEYFLDFGITSIIAIVFCFAPIVFAFLFNNKNKNLIISYKYTNNLVCSICDIVSAVATAYLAIYSASCMKFASSNTVAGINVEIPFVVVTFILAFYLIVRSVFMATNKEKLFFEVPVVELIPVVWAIMLVIYSFIHHTMSILTQENLFIMLIATTILLTTMAKARLFTRVDEENKGFSRLFLFTGVSTALSTSYLLSSILIFIFGCDKNIMLPLPMQIICFVLSFSSFVFVIKSKFRASIKQDAQKKYLPRH